MIANGFGGTFELEVVSAALSKTWKYTLYRQAIRDFDVRFCRTPLAFGLEKSTRFDAFGHFIVKTDLE